MDLLYHLTKVACCYILANSHSNVKPKRMILLKIVIVFSESVFQHDHESYLRSLAILPVAYPRGFRSLHQTQW